MARPESGGARAAGSTDGLTRRRFLTYVVSAPTLTVAARFGIDALDSPAAATPGFPDLFDLGDFLTLSCLPTSRDLVLYVTPENRVVIEVPREEVGQGITTSVAIMVAEELDARMEDVDAPISDARPDLLFNQLTGGSNSVRSLYEPVRAMAAAARARLVTAAANRWGVPANTLTTRDTMVFAPDGRSATYGSLTAEAARVTMPAVSPLPKPESQQRVIGKAHNRIDARDLVTGRAKFTLDLDIPGAKPTVVARPPTIKGTVASVDDTTARAMPGVLHVTRIPTGVAVTAETFDQALKARDALQITWNPGPLAGLSDVDIRQRLASSVLPFLVPPLLTNFVDATFDFAFLPHAPLETMVAIADVRPDRAEIWMPAKSPIIALQTIAQTLGLPEGAVTLHVIRSGGSFGRRLFFDPGPEAAMISKAIGRPVKLLYTRADDMHHGRMRAATHHKIRATYLLNAILSYEHRVGAITTDLSHGLGDALTGGGFKALPTLNQSVFFTTLKVPYNFGLETELLREVDLPFPTSAWRSVWSAMVRGAEEIMVDEIARRLRYDPVGFRNAKLSSPRTRGVLAKVASAGQWGRAMEPGTAQGVAIHEEYKSCVAHLVEIDCRDVEPPRVTKAVIAVDVGRPINRSGLESQMISGTMDGISSVLQAGVHIDNGAVRESSYTDFRWARMRHSPPDIQVHIMPANGPPGGAGELGVPSAVGAVANAYARATGTSPRSFPIAG